MEGRRCERRKPIKRKKGRRFNDRRGGRYFHRAVGGELIKADGLRDK